MTWNIANAKQQFSEVVRLAAEEPQEIYNRDKPVAAVISSADLEEFRRLKAERNRPSLSEQFDAIRAALIADGFPDGIEIPPRRSRPNPFDDPGWDA